MRSIYSHLSKVFVKHPVALTEPAATTFLITEIAVNVVAQEESNLEVNQSSSVIQG